LPFGSSDAPIPTDTPFVSILAKCDNAIVIVRSESCKFLRHLHYLGTDPTLDATDKRTQSKTLKTLLQGLGGTIPWA
jgi:hypothetical protein